jgi:hypothetical protein
MSWSDKVGGSDPQVHLSKRNAIHKENMGIAIARALAGQVGGHVYTMNFGTGGATVDALDAITYAAPNVTGSANLNVPVYSEVVDEDRGAPDGNQTSVIHNSGSVASDVEIRCVLDKSEPAGQATFDNVTTDLAGSFVFDEIGLKTDDGLLITHITFNPIQKTENRIMQVIYTLRVAIV